MNRLFIDGWCDDLRRKLILFLCELLDLVKVCQSVIVPEPSKSVRPSKLTSVCPKELVRGPQIIFRQAIPFAARLSY